MSPDRGWCTRPVVRAIGALLYLWWAAPLVAHGEPQLYDNLGTLHHPISTASDPAQRYFDQGLRLVYAFNHEIRKVNRGRDKGGEPLDGLGIALRQGYVTSALMDAKRTNQRMAELGQSEIRTMTQACVAAGGLNMTNSVPAFASAKLPRTGASQ